MQTRQRKNATGVLPQLYFYAETKDRFIPDTISDLDYFIKRNKSLLTIVVLFFIDSFAILNLINVLRLFL